MSQITKKALAAALKKLLKENTLDKITVQDIVDECELTRNTFYYHFRDIYDLIEWVFQTDTIEVIEKNVTYDSLQQSIMFVLEAAVENKNLVRNVYKSSCMKYLKKYFDDIMYSKLMRIVNELAIDVAISEDDRDFIARFYKNALVGILLEWVEGNMAESPQNITDRLNRLMSGSIANAVQNSLKD